MDGMSDACGTLQGDVVQKHGSSSVASPQGCSGAADGALSPAQTWEKWRANIGIYEWDSNISINAVKMGNINVKQPLRVNERSNSQATQ